MKHSKPRSFKFHLALKSIGFKTYEDYINSPGWRNRRYKAVHGKKCEACGSKNRLVWHHKTYRRLGNEPSKDMMVLCDSCHERIHLFLDERYPKLDLNHKAENTHIALMEIFGIGKIPPCQNRPKRLRCKRQVVFTKSQHETRDYLAAFPEEIEIMKLPTIQERIAARISLRAKEQRP